MVLLIHSLHKFIALHIQCTVFMYFPHSHLRIIINIKLFESVLLHLSCGFNFIFHIGRIIYSIHISLIPHNFIGYLINLNTHIKSVPHRIAYSSYISSYVIFRTMTPVPVRIIAAFTRIDSCCKHKMCWICIRCINPYKRYNLILQRLS